SDHVHAVNRKCEATNSPGCMAAVCGATQPCIERKLTIRRRLGLSRGQLRRRAAPDRAFRAGVRPDNASECGVSADHCHLWQVAPIVVTPDVADADDLIAELHLVTRMNVGTGPCSLPIAGGEDFVG